ncbi:hypothetical protein TTHERM_000580369 (macronuclear) [Tetrahymena thermophila SB210]|uniref:Uncharacterized protein n=1 Tax=Tetrahymena thermophila (strain SB210) TaxID=312017 RepID=W7XHF4_TETTS|nr:hypothetical protein TTHERM_000580369 [Tetrahymena thermophila SB210]EWS72524.1 hypothetical protein TTHERM_000580369 [Tetrahymena thermophila SB210]|eukprot:XP_012654960.1 hypothetical protein TTHERM_000580369 [Tetrahymena thermophila SB210]
MNYKEYKLNKQIHFNTQEKQKIQKNVCAFDLCRISLDSCLQIFGKVELQLTNSVFYTIYGSLVNSFYLF